MSLLKLKQTKLQRTENKTTIQYNTKARIYNYKIKETRENYASYKNINHKLHAKYDRL